MTQYTFETIPLGAEITYINSKGGRTTARVMTKIEKVTHRYSRKHGKAVEQIRKRITVEYYEYKWPTRVALTQFNNVLSVNYNQ